MFYEVECDSCKQSIVAWCLLRVFDLKKQGPASWSNGYEFVPAAGGQRLKSRAGQIGHSVAIGSPPLWHFFERNGVAPAQWRRNVPRQLVIHFGV